MRAEAVILHGDGRGVEARLHAEQVERGAQGDRVEVAGAHVGARARPAGGRAVPRPCSRRPRVRRGRGPCPGRRRTSAPPPRWRRRRGRRRGAPSWRAPPAPPPIVGPVNKTVWPRSVAWAICAATTCVRDGTTSLTAFSSGWPGRVRRMSAVPVPTSTARMRVSESRGSGAAPGGGSPAAGRGAVVGAAAHAGRRAGHLAEAELPDVGHGLEHDVVAHLALARPCGRRR